MAVCTAVRRPLITEEDLRLSRLPNTSSYDVVVIGMGAAGAATLRALAASGSRVRGLDRFDPPHDRGSSHGQSRITRQAIGEGGAYVPLAVRSQKIWRELEQQGDERLFSDIGCLILSDAEDRNQRPAGEAFIDRTLSAARDQGIVHEVLDADEIRRRHPQFNVDDDVLGYFEADSGFLHVEACIRAQLRHARAAGAETTPFATVVSVKQVGDHVETTLDTGEVLHSARAVVSAGGWAARLLGAPFDSLLSTTRQVMHWFPVEGDDTIRTAWEQSPVFIWRHGAHRDAFFYGFPTIDGRFKTADEAYGPDLSADTVDRDVPLSDSQRMYDDHVGGRLRGAQPGPTSAVTCLYTMTPDSNFIIDRHPDQPLIEVVSPCSGHGFKHAAAIGEAVAQRLLTGASQIDLSPFSLSRFGAAYA